MSDFPTTLYTRERERKSERKREKEREKKRERERMRERIFSGRKIKNQGKEILKEHEHVRIGVRGTHAEQIKRRLEGDICRVRTTVTKCFAEEEKKFEFANDERRDI